MRVYHWSEVDDVRPSRPAREPFLYGTMDVRQTPSRKRPRYCRLSTYQAGRGEGDRSERVTTGREHVAPFGLMNVQAAYVTCLVGLHSTGTAARPTERKTRRVS